MRYTGMNGRRGAITAALIGAAGLLVTACGQDVTSPAASGETMTRAGSSASALTDIVVYQDRTAWEAAVTNAGGTWSRFDFTGLTTGRVTQTTTNYGEFSIVVDRVSATAFSNPGIDIFPAASCGFVSGDCNVFTFNVYDPTTIFDGPLYNVLGFANPVIAFGGTFEQTGVTAPANDPTGAVTLEIGSQSFVLNDYLDANGDGFVGFVAPAAVGEIKFTFAKSGSLQNDIFQVYDPVIGIGGDTETPEEMIEDVLATIAGSGLPKGTATSLNAKLNAALAALAGGNSDGACTALQDLINAANAQSGKKISVGLAANIISQASAIRAALGC